MRTTHIPYREWSWHARLIERVYRWTHGGQIRTLSLPRFEPGDTAYWAFHDAAHCQGECPRHPEVPS